MSTVKFTDLNWYQRLMAQAVGLDPAGCVVRLESEDMIVYLEHKSRMEYIVNKTTGKVIEA